VAVLTVRVPRLPISAVLRPRTGIVCAVLVVLTAAAFCVGLTFGDYPVSVGEVVRAVLGKGDGGTLFIVRELRLPRALVGLLAGAAFGIAGALYQTTTRNPLASPDMIGISQGAAVAVVAGIAFKPGIGTQVLGVAGALGVAVLTTLLAWRRGASGYRIVLVGIGVAWMCASLTEYLLVRADISEAQQSMGWLVGNLNARDWVHVTPLARAMLVLVPVALLMSRRMRILQLGDDVASGLGIPPRTTRTALLIVGAALVAFATAAAGPIAFVALATPQIAQRLTGNASPPLVASALTGAVVVLAADSIARVAVPGHPLPVGVVTGVLGAPVLLWLLARANLGRTGGTP
jgi:iron complex transport system permease protein